MKRVLLRFWQITVVDVELFPIHAPFLCFSPASCNKLNSILPMLNWFSFRIPYTCLCCYVNNSNLSSIRCLLFSCTLPTMISAGHKARTKFSFSKRNGIIECLCSFLASVVTASIIRLASGCACSDQTKALGLNMKQSDGNSVDSVWIWLESTSERFALGSTQNTDEFIVTRALGMSFKKLHWLCSEWLPEFYMNTIS